MSYFDDRSDRTETTPKVAKPRVQRLVTGFRCEIKGCFKQGEWYINFDDRAFHWCSNHTSERMHDSKFWENRAKAKDR